MAVRPPDRVDDDVHRAEVREAARDRRGEPEGVQHGLRVRRDVRVVRGAVRGEAREAAAGAVPADHRQHGALVGAARRVEALGAAALPRRVPDHAGVVDPRGALEAQELRRAHVPGGGRDRRRRCRARRVVRRLARRHHVGRPGRRAQVGDDRPRRCARAAARGDRRAARRALDRDADEAGAGRPADGAVRAQRRVAGAGARRRDAGRLLLRGDRGRARRGHVPHAGLPALRRVPRERHGAVADPRARRPRPDRGRVRRRRRRRRSSPTGATPRRSRGRGRSRARRASSIASAGSRRPTRPARSPTTPRTTT